MKTPKRIARIMRPEGKCSLCGEPINLKDYNLNYHLPQKMKKEQLCFSCAFWMHHYENPDPNREIIDGAHYIFKPLNPNKTYFKGFGGRMMYILHDDLTVKCSNDVWHQGVIPDHLKHLFPNTAKFITGSQFATIRKRQGFSCWKKGCWDRYRCIFYDPKLREPDGPWNEIPEDWEAGGEGCDGYVDKKTIE